MAVTIDRAVQKGQACWLKVGRVTLDDKWRWQKVYFQAWKTDRQMYGLAVVVTDSKGIANIWDTTLISFTEEPPESGEIVEG